MLACARTPDETFDATVRHAPWLVVIDVALDGGSGIDAARRLQARDGRRCVFLSGRLDGPTRTEINRLDPIAVLSKPLLGSQLLDVVTRLRRDGNRAPPRRPRRGSDARVVVSFVLPLVVPETPRPWKSRSSQRSVPR